MNKLHYSGHDTFVVRTFWPKKGYDFITHNGDFNADNSVVELGVGKNMVSSIKFWMKALNLINEDDNRQTQLADFLFAENGADPYLEDTASIWILHYFLIKYNYATIYNLVFNQFRKERSTFTKKQLHTYIKRQFQEQDNNGYNTNTIDKDISVFLRTYNTPDYNSIKKNLEDEIGGLFQEIELMSSGRETDIDEIKVDWFDLSGKDRATLPVEVILFSILDSFPESNNISLRRLEIEENSPGMVFALSREALFNKLKEMETIVDGIIVSESAGNISLVIPEGLNKWDILRNYYAE
jgi:hypothetical protein